jgi:hypothetical protein
VETLEVFVVGAWVIWGTRYPFERMLDRFGAGPFKILEVIPVSEELIGLSGQYILTINDLSGNKQRFSCLWFNKYII